MPYTVFSCSFPLSAGPERGIEMIVHRDMAGDTSTWVDMSNDVTGWELFGVMDAYLSRDDVTGVTVGLNTILKDWNV
jgi:hypothetical protein